MLKQVENYCSELIKTSSCASLPFHNIEHTKEVVSNVNTIADYIGLSVNEREPILVAAWFHDTGHSKVYNGHEDASKILAKKFLEDVCYDNEKITKVLMAIEATKMPQKCTDKSSAILCDADVFHIGNSDFFYKKLLLRREWIIKDICHVEDIEWHQLNLKFIHNHHFHSKYGKEVLEKGKLENKKKVRYILSFY